VLDSNIKLLEVVAGSGIRDRPVQLGGLIASEMAIAPRPNLDCIKEDPPFRLTLPGYM